MPNALRERHQLGVRVLLRLRRQYGSIADVAEDYWNEPTSGHDNLHLNLTGNAEDLLIEAWRVASQQTGAIGGEPLFIARVYEDLAVRLVIIDGQKLVYNAECPELFKCRSRREFETLCEQLVLSLIEHIGTKTSAPSDSAERVRQELISDQQRLDELHRRVRTLTELKHLLLASEPRLVHEDSLAEIRKAAAPFGIRVVAEKPEDRPDSVPWVWAHAEST